MFKFKPTKNPLIQPLKNKLHLSQEFSHFVIFGPQLIHENYELRQHSSHAIIFIGWAVEKKPIFGRRPRDQERKDARCVCWLTVWVKLGLGEAAPWARPFVLISGRLSQISVRHTSFCQA